MYNIKNQIFQKYSSKEDRDKLLTIYPDCFEYLKSEVVKFAKSMFIRVYRINNFRKQVIPLTDFLNSISFRSQAPWSFDVYIDEKNLIYETSRGEEIYEIRGSGRIVTDIDHYFKTPINGLNEIDYVKNHLTNWIDTFVNTDFLTYINNKMKEKQR